MAVVTASMDTQPSRLSRDPILEALCEVRFESQSSNVGALMPGLLYERLKSAYPNFEKLPMADLPSVIRDSDPNLRYQPQYRLQGAEGVVQVGERMISIASVGAKYPGWRVFREAVRSSWSAAVSTGLISTVSRLSIKVVNLLPVPQGAGISDVTSVVLKFGDSVIGAQPTDLRTEIINGDHTTSVRLAHPANVSMLSGESRTGLVLDVDTIRMTPVPMPIDNLLPLFELAHNEEKRVFFSLLSPETLRACEPIYE